MPTDHMESILKQRLTRLICIISCGGIFVSIAIMAMWIVNPDLIEILLPVSATTKFNTALLFGAVSLHITLYHQQKYQLHDKLPYLSLGILLISLMTLIAYPLHIDLFLDELIVNDPLTTDGYPGRMSEVTAVLFIILSLALLTFRQYPRLAELLAGITNLIALLALLAFVFDFEALYSITFFDTVSFFTALLFVALSGVTVLSIPQSIVRNLLLLDQPAGVAMRWLLPIILVIPTAFGWLVLRGLEQQLYKPAFALVMVTMLTVAIQLLMVIAYALTVQFTYQRQQKLQRDLLQTQLDSELERLELKNTRALNKMKEEFFVMLSHDMRTPITSIVTSSETMLRFDDQLSAEKREEYLKRIKHQAFSVLDFVDDLTLLSQFQLGQIPYSPVNDDFATFCRQYYAEFVSINELDNHDLILEIPDTPIELEFDHKLVKRLLSNLIGNALKYSPDGGAVILHVEEDNNRVNLRIKDEGMGIPETELSTLFELFQRAKNVEDISGYGLGLAIVKQIATTHDATISVQSQVGVGSTFTITFPLL